MVSKAKDSLGEQVYSILCQLYDAELHPDTAFQMLLDVLVSVDKEWKNQLQPPQEVEE